MYCNTTVKITKNCSSKSIHVGSRASILIAITNNTTHLCYADNINLDNSYKQSIT